MRSRLVQPSFPSLTIEPKRERAIVVILPIPLSHRKSYTVSQYSRALYYFVALLKKNESTTTKKKKISIHSWEGRNERVFSLLLICCVLSMLLRSGLAYANGICTSIERREGKQTTREKKNKRSAGDGVGMLSLFISFFFSFFYECAPEWVEEKQFHREWGG